jgi:putative ABC transport system substrate-binding protein
MTASSKAPRIGYVTLGTLETEQPFLDTFHQGLLALGYREGENILIDRREAAGETERLPQLIADLLASGVKILVAVSSPATVAAKAATSTVPIVTIGHPDPVRTGLVASLAHPGGNITGLSDLHAGIITKRLELLLEAVASVSRLGVLWNPDEAAHHFQVQDLETPTRQAGISTILAEARRPEEFEQAFAMLRQGQSQALFVLGSRVFFSQAQRIATLALESGLPGTFTQPQWPRAGGLMSFGSHTPDLFRRAATYVDKILKGTPAGDIPMEQPTTFDCVVNLKTAQALGLTIPSSVLDQATEIIQ